MTVETKINPETLGRMLLKKDILEMFCYERNAIKLGTDKTYNHDSIYITVSSSNIKAQFCFCGS